MNADYTSSGILNVRRVKPEEATRAWLEIDLTAIEHNIRQIQSMLNPGTKILGVVKADAYGHGAVEVALVAERNGVEWLGVATVAEGVELRRAGLSCGILVFCPIRTAHELHDMMKLRLSATLCSLEHAELLSLLLAGRALSVHVKVDTGMSRLGASPEESLELIRTIQSRREYRLEGIYSHLACGEAPESDTSLTQLQKLLDLVHDIKMVDNTTLLHIANSAGVLLGSEFHLNMVRTGLLMYGYAPRTCSCSLRAAMRVCARVTQIREIPSGTGVSYGHKFVSGGAMRIATVGIGYADGVPRSLSGKIVCEIRGQQAPQIGAISMDQLMIDVTDVLNPSPGDVVTLIGGESPAQSIVRWAIAANTIAWELLCGFRGRLPKLFVPT